MSLISREFFGLIRLTNSSIQYWNWTELERLEDPSGFPKLGHGVELNHPWMVESFWMWYLATPMSFSEFFSRFSPSTHRFTSLSKFCPFLSLSGDYFYDKRLISLSVLLVPVDLELKQLGQTLDLVVKDSEDEFLLFLLAKVNCQPGDITGLLHFCFRFIDFFLTPREFPEVSSHGRNSEFHRVTEVELLFVASAEHTVPEKHAQVFSVTGLPFALNISICQ